MQAQIVRHLTFEAGLNAFEGEDMKQIGELKRNILEAGHSQAGEIEDKYNKVNSQ